jgi:hypothetical protein
MQEMSMPLVPTQPLPWPGHAGEIPPAKPVPPGRAPELPPANPPVEGSAGADVLVGKKGNDAILGHGGADRIHGVLGDDVLAGGLGADTIFGGAGNDTVSGGGGRDLIRGGAGRDELTGGADSDTFVFTPGSGVDRITDFEVGVDRLKIAGSTGHASAVDTAEGVELHFSSGDVIELVGVDPAEVDPGLFL